MTIQLAERVIFDGPIRVNFQGRPRLRNMFDVQGLIIDRPGALVFTVTHENVAMASWRIAVNDIGHPVVQQELPLPADGQEQQPRQEHRPEE